MSKTKKCSCCGQHKPLSEFHKNKSRKDGLNHDCKVCKLARTKAHADKMREMLKKHNEQVVEAKNALEIMEACQPKPTFWQSFKKWIESFF